MIKRKPEQMNDNVHWFCRLFVIFTSSVEMFYWNTFNRLYWLPNPIMQSELAQKKCAAVPNGTSSRIYFALGWSDTFFFTYYDGLRAHVESLRKQSVNVFGSSFSLDASHGLLCTMDFAIQFNYKVKISLDYCRSTTAHSFLLRKNRIAWK